MTRSLVYTLHLWPPIAHAKHYTAAVARAKRLPDPLPTRPAAGSPHRG